MRDNFNKAKGLQGQLDSDLKFLHTVLNNMWMKDNGVDAQTITLDQREEMNKFKTQNTSTALKAMDAWSKEFGEPMVQAEYIRQTAAIEKAVRQQIAKAPAPSSPVKPK